MGRIPDGNLIVRKLQQLPFVVCATPGYWEQRGLPAHPDDLSDHRAPGKRREGREVWCVFDNTAGSAAAHNAVQLKQALDEEFR